MWASPATTVAHADWPPFQPRVARLVGFDEIRHEVEAHLHIVSLLVVTVAVFSLKSSKPVLEVKVNEVADVSLAGPTISATKTLSSASSSAA